MSRIRFSRRELLRLASAAGFAGLLPLAARAADFSALAVLDAAQGRRLLAVLRTLFPHDFLDDDYYGNIVATIDAKAEADPAIGETLTAGLADLPAGFVTMDEAGREASLRRIEDTPFFSFVYAEALPGLYGNADIARLLGDEGPSAPFGGYIDRGFDAIDWLPVEQVRQ